jgi:hypothetical protein
VTLRLMPTRGSHLGGRPLLGVRGGAVLDELPDVLQQCDRQRVQVMALPATVRRRQGGKPKIAAAAAAEAVLYMRIRMVAGLQWQL